MAAGEDKALDIFMQRHQVRLYRFVLRCTGEPNLAADITQDSFVRTWFAANRYSSGKGASGRTWLFSIARNIVRDHARRRNPFVRMANWFIADKYGHNSTLETIPSRDAEPPAVAEQRELDDALKDAITRLPDKLRMPLVMCVIEGIPQEEAAQILGTSRKAVELRIRRAKDKLRRCLELTQDRPSG